jgi:hypothetical protein
VTISLFLKNGNQQLAASIKGEARLQVKQKKEKDKESYVSFLHAFSASSSQRLFAFLFVCLCSHRPEKCKEISST